MRVTDGEREVDKAGLELMLKVIKEESAQRQLLAGGGGGRGRRQEAAGRHDRRATPSENGHSGTTEEHAHQDYQDYHTRVSECACRDLNL